MGCVRSRRRCVDPLGMSRRIEVFERTEIGFDEDPIDHRGWGLCIVRLIDHSALEQAYLVVSLGWVHRIGESRETVRCMHRPE
jgi:hypothetical protein